MPKTSLLRWERNRGRNGNDLPGDLLVHQTAESFNVLVGDSSIGTKRHGTATQTITGDAFSGYNALGRFIAGQDDTAAQLFIVSRDATTKALRVTGGTAATNLTLISAILATRPQDCSFATINGKLYIAIRLASNVNRMLVYDPAYSTTALRYAGLGTPAAPTAANGGAGGPAATLRYYRVAWREKRGAVIVRQSLFGAAVSFTNTAGLVTTVTKPTGTSPGEGETHWVVAGSADGLAYYELSEIVVGTTTYSDAAAPSTYANNAAIADEGANTPLASFKFVVATDDRLVFAGAYEPGLAASVSGTLVTKDGTVYFTPVLDSSVIHDDERISNTVDFKGYIGINRNAGSEDRALMGPLDGQLFFAQSRGITRLIPTGDANAPYRKRTLSKTLGAVNNQSWFVGEDETGALCIYWLDPARGPYRYGPGGIQWCGYDVFDLWQTMNLSATGIAAHGVFHDELKLALWWISTGASNDPDKIIAFRVQEGRPTRDENGVIGVRYGWMNWTVPSSGERCSVNFSKAFAATMSRKFKPYAGDASVLARLDDESSTQDLGVSYQGYTTSRAWEEPPSQRLKTLHKSYVLADAASVTITQTLSRNYGAESRTSTVSLAAAGSETRVLKKFGADSSGANDSALKDAYTFQTTLGDSAAANTAWTLHDWYALVEITDQDA